MKVSAKIQQRTNELIAQIKIARSPVAKTLGRSLPDAVAQAERHIHSLLFDADLARLDGKNMRAHTLRREAARLQRALPPQPAKCA